MAQKYMIDLPNPDSPGEFFDEGPMTEAEAKDYLGQWGLAEHWQLFATELNQGEEPEEDE